MCINSPPVYMYLHEVEVVDITCKDLPQIHPILHSLFIHSSSYEAKFSEGAILIFISVFLLLHTSFLCVYVWGDCHKLDRELNHECFAPSSFLQSDRPAKVTLTPVILRQHLVDMQMYNKYNKPPKNWTFRSLIIYATWSLKKWTEFKSRGAIRN